MGRIGAGMYRITVTVVASARKERLNFIIGADFLTVDVCDISFMQKIFTMGERKLEFIPK